MNPTAIPDWLLPSIVLIPALLWMFLGVGIPWALALLPRSDWRDRVTVLAVALALGPALTTTAMFVIGTFGHFTVTNVLGSSALIAGIGLGLATRNHAVYQAKVTPQRPMTLLDLTLIGVVAVMLILRFWNAAYWPYTTYDEFWVYGYNAKVFMLQGAIPSTIGYYPQLIPLTYTYGQLMWGGVNDHAARAAVPVFALVSALMAYVLGARLFNRRVGLLTAAIWMLYPHNAAWSQFGDLEVPVTLYFTGTAAFFILGWREQNRRYTVLSGLLMGAALWTKPTAGALIESVGLAMAVLAVRGWICQREHNIRLLRESKELQYPLLAAVVALPMGGMWYIRNALYGLPPLVFPAGYWQLQAQRSGQELGWLLAIALVVTALLITHRRRMVAAVAGLALILAASLPSAFGWRVPTFQEIGQLALGNVVPTITPTHLTPIEILVILTGCALLGWAALPLWRLLEDRTRVTLLLICVFILPYFVTWFWSYSYHFRLSFPIVPLLIVLVAALIESWLSFHVVQYPSARRAYILAGSSVILALALPGLLATLLAVEPAITRTLPTDHAKMARGNGSLMALVDSLRDQRDPNHRPASLSRPMIVEAPGELRLPFFFPLDDIRTDRYPLFLDQIADVDYFVDSSVGQRLYIENGKQYNQILSSLTRDNVMLRLYTVDDGNFRFSVYDIDNRARFKAPKPNGPINVQVGDFAWLVGYDLSRSDNIPGQAIFLTLWWKVLKPADRDYSVYIHLWNPREQKLALQAGGEPVSGAFSVWDRVPGAHFNVPYHTRLWQPGEFVKDEWKIIVPDAAPGVYEMRVGLYDSVGQERLPVARDGVVVGDGVLLHDFTILGP
jgi:4-amino-4-deoxy-L-arabinose transferase-like glycosyltransferase